MIRLDCTDLHIGLIFDALYLRKSTCKETFLFFFPLYFTKPNKIYLGHHKASSVQVWFPKEQNHIAVIYDPTDPRKHFIANSLRHKYDGRRSSRIHFISNRAWLIVWMYNNLYGEEWEQRYAQIPERLTGM